MGIFVKKIKYKFVLLRKIDSSMVIVRVIVKKLPNELLKVGNRTYNVCLQAPSYHVKNFKVYLLDFDSGSQYVHQSKFEEVKPLINPEKLDDLISNKLLKEIAQGVMDDRKTKLIWMLLGALIGGMLIWIIADILHNKEIQKLYEQFQVINIGY